MSGKNNNLIVGIIIGLIIGIILGFIFFNKTNSSNNEIIRTQADSFPLEKIVKLSEFNDISFSIEDCRNYKLGKTSTPEKIKDLDCSIDNTQAVLYPDDSGKLDNIRVMALCWCDYNVE